MREFVKPIIVISKCLGFDFCRYDGRVLPINPVSKLAPFVTFLAVCPEIEVGLGVPRPPIHLVSGANGIKLIQPETSMEITERMKTFADSFLDSLQDVDGFILKSSSPSCGLKNIKVFSGPDKKESVGKSVGMFAAVVLGHFSDAALIEESDLQDSESRELFLTKLFALADLRAVKRSGSIKNLAEFHLRNKLLLMSYSQKQSKILGRLVANKNEKPFGKIIADYAHRLSAAFGAKQDTDSNANVMLHAFGRFSGKLSSLEISEFLKMLDRYRRGEVPLDSCKKLLQEWMPRFEERDLLRQTFFAPFPAELA